MEERLNGIEEVVSSILIGSTNLLIYNKLRNILRHVPDGPYRGPLSQKLSPEGAAIEQAAFAFRQRGLR